MYSYYGMCENQMESLILFEAAKQGSIATINERLTDKQRREILSGAIYIWDERKSGIKRWTDGISWSNSRVAGPFLEYRQTEPDTSGNGGFRIKPYGLRKRTLCLSWGPDDAKLHLICYYTKHDARNGILPLPSADPRFAAIVDRVRKGMRAKSQSSYDSTGSNSPVMPHDVHLLNSMTALTSMPPNVANVTNVPQQLQMPQPPPYMGMPMAGPPPPQMQPHMQQPPPQMPHPQMQQPQMQQPPPPPMQQQTLSSAMPIATPMATPSMLPINQHHQMASPQLPSPQMASPPSSVSSLRQNSSSSISSIRQNSTGSISSVGSISHPMGSPVSDMSVPTNFPWSALPQLLPSPIERRGSRGSEDTRALGLLNRKAFCGLPVTV